MSSRSAEVEHAQPRTVVHKFGGTSLGTEERIAAAAAILRDAAKRETVVAIVSATAGTTNALLAAASDAQSASRRPTISVRESCAASLVTRAAATAAARIHLVGIAGDAIAPVEGSKKTATTGGGS